MLDGVWNKMSITQKMCLQLSAFTLMQNLLTIYNKDPFEQVVSTLYLQWQAVLSSFPMMVLAG